MGNELVVDGWWSGRGIWAKSFVTDIVVTHQMPRPCRLLVVDGWWLVVGARHLSQELCDGHRKLFTKCPACSGSWVETRHVAFLKDGA